MADGSATSSGEALVRDFWSRWDARDWDGLRGLVTSDFVHHDERHDIGMDGYIEGSKGACSMFGDYHIAVEQVVDGGDEVAVRWKGRGRHDRSFMGEEPSGRELIVRGMDFFRLDGGKLAENWQIMDMTGLRKQIEAIRDEGSAS